MHYGENQDLVYTGLGPKLGEMPDWSALSPSDFERLCFKLVSKEGFKNVNLYGGSGDRARDIVAEYFVDIGRRTEVFKFMIQCKRITSRSTLGVSDISGLKNWMDSHEGFQRALIITSADASPDTRDWLEGINKKNKYKIDIWDKTELEKMMTNHPALVNEYFGKRQLLSKSILQDYRKLVKSKSIAEQVRMIKDETGCYIRGVIVFKESMVVSYVDFGRDLKQFEIEFTAVISIIAKMYNPSTKYKIIVYNNMMISRDGFDYPEMLTGEVSASILQRYIIDKITLDELWENIKFFRKTPHIGKIEINQLQIPLVI